jgi:3-hydroxyisobutyrate dehydrogenase
MGAPMAASLLVAGHALKVYDARRQAGAALVANGATWAETAGEAGRGAEVVFSCLPGPKEVDAVAEELLERMAADSAWFELSTNSPEGVRRLGERFDARGVHLLDAPVSGGPKGAAERRLAIWVGGDARVYERHRALLHVMGDEPMYIGSLGAGSVAKLAHNCANFSMQLLLAEVFTLGVKAGVEPLTLFKALRQGTAGRKRTFDRLAEQFLPGVYDPPAFALRLAHKDMKLAMELARSCGVPMRMASIALEEFGEAVQRGWSERDARVAMVLQEERAGVSPRVSAQSLYEVMDG